MSLVTGVDGNQYTREQLAERAKIAAEPVLRQQQAFMSVLCDKNGNISDDGRKMLTELAVHFGVMDIEFHPDARRQAFADGARAAVIHIMTVVGFDKRALIDDLIDRQTKKINVR